CAYPLQPRGPTRPPPPRPRLDWATPAQCPLALTLAPAANVVRRTTALRSFPAEDDATERCDRHRDLPVRASGGRAVLVALAVAASKKAIRIFSFPSAVLLGSFRFLREQRLHKILGVK